MNSYTGVIKITIKQLYNTIQTQVLPTYYILILLHSATLKGYLSDITDLAENDLFLNGSLKCATHSLSVK